LYRSGLEEYEENNVDDLNTILFMAVEGGHVEIIGWSLSQGAELEKIPQGLIGKNIAQVLDFVGTKEEMSLDLAALYLFGAASFGQEMDLDYVFELYGDSNVPDKVIFDAYTGALQNNNPAGIEYLERMLNISKDKAAHTLLATSAARGNNLVHLKKYLVDAGKVVPSLYLAIAHGNMEMIKFIKSKKKFSQLKQAWLYAGYSGSSEILELVASWKECGTSPEYTAYGAIAAGNWDYLETNLTALELDGLSRAKKIKLYSQLFAEAVNHSQLSMVETLLEREMSLIQEGDENAFNLDDLRTILEQAQSLPSLLKELNKSMIYHRVLRRLGQVLAV
jgi:hypothetical protein